MNFPVRKQNLEYKSSREQADKYNQNNHFGFFGLYNLEGEFGMNQIIEEEKLHKAINLESFEVWFGHIDCICKTCGRKWGVRPNERGEIKESQLRCFKCDSKKLAKIEETKKQ